MLLEAPQNLFRAFAAALLEHKIQRVQPFPQFDVFRLRGTAGVRHAHLWTPNRTGWPSFYFD
ncbi:MAG: hypothetical protein DMG31_15990 [Acidobacteria bacterium]|nr:MAG: hypothetical protein DMG31_15990 [Acidobacteriota bacterium]